MSELLEILLVAFCGLVLVFAILFIGCWCVIACAFYCLKHFYKRTVTLDSMVSAMTLTSSSDAASDDFGSEIESRVYSSHGAQGYLESLETGSAAVTSIAESHYQSLARMETGISRNLQGNESSSTDLRKVKVACDDIPPQYETLSPPTYQSLFPEDETMIPHLLHVNEKANPGEF